MSSSSAQNLDAAQAAFDAGNHALAREIALRLKDDPTQAAQANELLERLSPAPLGKYLLLLTVVLLVAVTVFAYSQ